MSRLLPLSLAIGLTLAGAASAFTNEHGLDARNFDPKTPACTDFSRHANGGWLDSRGAENGDKCAWISSGQGAASNIHLSTGTFPVQSLWSNAFNGGSGGCVLSY